MLPTVIYSNELHWAQDLLANNNVKNLIVLLITWKAILRIAVMQQTKNPNKSQSVNSLKAFLNTHRVDGLTRAFMLHTDFHIDFAFPIQVVAYSTTQSYWLCTKTTVDLPVLQMTRLCISWPMATISDWVVEAKRSMRSAFLQLQLNFLVY